MLTINNRTYAISISSPLTEKLQKEIVDVIRSLEPEELFNKTPIELSMLIQYKIEKKFDLYVNNIPLHSRINVSLIKNGNIECSIEN